MKISKSSQEKRLVVLDAHAIIHRAYHALPDFTGPSGEPTGALYGLFSMLLRIYQELEPDYIVAAYDLAAPTVRHEAYDEYKGTRQKTDNALIEQLTSSRNVFKALSIPVYEREGFEADDVIATIVEKLKDKHVEVIIASGDMDTMQLAHGKKVQVYTLKKGINDTILYDEAAVQERYGFAPVHIADYKGLRGDPSDNIKGVPGVGEKTATELIQKFGTLEEIYALLKKNRQKLLDAGIKERIVKLLEEHEEDARFSKTIALLRNDAKIAFALPKKNWMEQVKLKDVLALCDLHGFRTLRTRAQQLFNEESEETEDREEERIEPLMLEEAKVMVWLLASDFTNPNEEDVLGYSGKDSFKEAHAYLEQEIKKAGKLEEVYEHIERPLIPILARMRERGMLIDKTVLASLSKTYKKELAEIEKKIYSYAGKEFNIASPKQLGDILFDELGLSAPDGKRVKKTATGQRSTKESELEKLREEHPIVEAVLEYRGLAKLLSTYIETIPPLLDAEHRLHAQFLQYGAATGRMACANPNLQNIPIRTERGRAIRHAFLPSDGYALLSFDYSQVELRIAAILSGDPKLCSIFQNGRDVHQEVAAAVFSVPFEEVDREMRRRAKIINFGILYGMGVNALRTQLGASVAEAQAFYDDYFKTFTVLAEYLESTKGFARKHGYTETLFGRRRQFPEMKSPLSYVRAQAERMAINAPIQGTQADIIKLAMVRVDRVLKERGEEEDARLLLQVHDELVYEVKAGRVHEIGREIKDIMEHVLGKETREGVPITTEAKTGPNWGEMKHTSFS